MSGEACDQPRRVSADGNSEGGINISGWQVLSRDLATVELPIRSVPNMPSEVCEFWLQFPRFVPNPTAPFVEEFDRLARDMAWSAKNRRKNLVKALAAEIDFHCDGSSGLIRWQRLCQELGVGSKPASITQCKKVSPKNLARATCPGRHRVGGRHRS